MFETVSTGWQALAACRGEDATPFFAPSYFERRAEKDAREAIAKASCRRCLVRDDCLAFALEVGKHTGSGAG
ncbi:MAG: WhiB family transcriptional regulator [Actinomycetota bacterium]